MRLSVEVSLVNGNHCYSNDSLYLIIDHYDGPEAFNEIAKHIGIGDSCSALVPSAMGFGIKGVPGVVPPGAMIQINATLPIDLANPKRLHLAFDIRFQILHHRRNKGLEH